jgi:quercetin dioxygenase-like cupin family protein
MDKLLVDFSGKALMLLTAADAPRHQTPNAVMRTLAAPSLGARELSVWEVVMTAGQRGPQHTADREQVWIVLEGELRVQLDEHDLTVRTGDVLRVPAGTERRIAATLPARALVASPAAPMVTTTDGQSRPLPWAA